jgi:glycerophosphoryl diester phosphodiesterase
VTATPAARDPGASRRPAPVLRLAHRGDHRRHLENSAAALVAAMAIPGVDGVEFDVRRSRDGVPVLLHDRDLRRVRGVSHRAADLSAAELASYGVSTVEAALRALPRDAFLDVELKEDVGAAGLDVVADVRGVAADRVAVSSFLTDALRTAARAHPGWERWLNLERVSDDDIRLAADLGCRAIVVDWRAIGPREVDRARAAGLAVGAFTVTRRGTEDRLARLGVRALCVEGPALLRFA